MSGQGLKKGPCSLGSGNINPTPVKITRGLRKTNEWFNESQTGTSQNTKKPGEKRH